MEIRRAMMVLLIAMSIPVILAATVFPTAMIDTRELLAWGREFPTGTFKHPPLMFWFGGIVDAIFGPHAFWSVLWSQVLNAIGVYYCWLILCRVTSRNIATLMAVYLGTSLTYSIYSLAYALNADMIQIAFWAAILFHLIRAIETNHWRHWLALGLAVGMAILAKYTAFLFLAALALSVLFDAKTRTILTRPGAWAALIIAGLLVLPHGLWVLAHPEAFDHAGGKIISQASLLGLAESYVILVGGTLALLAPGVIYHRGDWINASGVYLATPASRAGRKCLDTQARDNYPFQLRIDFGGAHSRNRSDLLHSLLIAIFVFGGDRRRPDDWLCAKN